MNRQKILIVEDSDDTLTFLKIILQKNYDLCFARDGKSALDAVKTEAPDLVLLDVLLPLINGYEVCKTLKNDPELKKIPVIFLSSKNLQEEVHYGLEIGADDYLVKPFDHNELKTRIQNRLNITSGIKSAMHGESMLKLGTIELELIERSVKVNGEEVSLTQTEFDILRLLGQKRGSVVSREEIMQTLWKQSAKTTSDRTIDVHIRSLRKKLPQLNEQIKTLYGQGYQLTLHSG